MAAKGRTMNTTDQNKHPTNPGEDIDIDEARRATLRRLGRFAAFTPPVVALILAANTKPAAAATSTVSSRQLKEPVRVAALLQAEEIL